MLGIKATLEDGVRVYDKEAFSIMSDACVIAKGIMQELIANAVEGNTTLELEKLAESLILKNKCKPLFKGYENFPFCTCMSNNEQIVHGLADGKPLKSGDILSIDLGLNYKGYSSDHARTICIGGSSNSPHKDLIEIAERAFDDAVKLAFPGSTTGAIGFSIHKRVISLLNRPGDWKSGYKFKIFADFQGHGIGIELHEPPGVPNIGNKGMGTTLREGMCICIEPVVMYKSSNIIRYLHNDVVHFKSDNNLPSAHYENQVFITEDGPVILTV